MVLILQSWSSALSLLLLASQAVPTSALPQRQQRPKNGNAASGGNGGGNGRGNNGNGNGNGQAATGPKITAATDGSTILDKTVTINGLQIRYKISGPANQFTAASGVTGGTAAANTTGGAGLNVLLHGDGGQSFIDFPNQAVQDNKMGVVVLAPDPNLFWGGGSGLQRTDGVAHAAAVNDLIQNQLSNDIAFDKTNVFFTGVSGGSLLLSGFFVPAFGATYKTGVVLNCAALEPQVPVVDGAAMIQSFKIHYQSTKDELALLQPAIPKAIQAYETLATNAGLSPEQIGALQTADNTPNGGGHCAFDGKGFVSGIQVMASAYSNIIGTNPDGQVPGIGNVLKTVVGNEKLVFTSKT